MSWDVVWSCMKAAEALRFSLTGWIKRELLRCGVPTYWQHRTLEETGDKERGEVKKKEGIRESREMTDK